jgi:peroxiredoxin Q/BCP
MLGKPVRDLSLAATRGTQFILPAQRGTTSALYFSPKEMRFPFELLAHAEEAVCGQLDVVKLESMYGKKVRGIERSTPVVDEKGVVREWRGIKVPGHAQEVLNFAKAL